MQKNENTIESGQTQSDFAKNHIDELNKKINTLLENIQLISNPNNEEIKNHLNNFVWLKKEIDVLLKTKNPISFLLQLKNLKESFFIHLENLIDFVEKEISLDNNTKHKLLYDLWINPLSFSNNNKHKYILDSKYFYEDVYFEAYSKKDKDFKYFVQKLISLKDNNNIKTEILKDEKYKKYTELLNFLESNNIDLSSLEIKQNNEHKFWYKLIKQYLNQEKANEEKIKFIQDFYSFFSFNLDDLKYLKEVDIDNIIKFNTINDYKESELNYDFIQKINVIFDIYKNNFNSEFYIKIFTEIQNELDAKKRWYLWWYIRNKIKTFYKIDNIFNSQDKLSESDWLENRINYRVALRNNKEKEESYKLMDWFNQFRNIILNIEDSIFSDFYKVYILKMLSERLTLKQDTYKNFKFFMLFLLPKNYIEYCKIYTFFWEYESYKLNKWFFKLYILSILLGFLLLFAIFFNISWLLWFGISLIIIGNYLRKTNFISKTFYIRSHLALNSFWYLIVLWYLILWLSNNWFFEVKVKLFDKVNNSKIVWQKLDETTFYKSSTYWLANILQYNKIKKD